MCTRCTYPIGGVRECQFCLDEGLEGLEGLDEYLEGLDEGLDEGLEGLEGLDARTMGGLFNPHSGGQIPRNRGGGANVTALGK